MSNTWRRIYLHVVWGTHQRLPLIDLSRERRMVGLLTARARNMSCELLAFGAYNDHVHLLLSLHPTVAPAVLVRSFKSGTSGEIERADPRDPPFRWQRGYAVLSVEPRDARGLSEYILHQRGHHAAGTIRGIWEPPNDALDEDNPS